MATSTFASQISVLHGQGDGTIKEPRSDYQVGTNAISIAVADFNGIGAPGFAVANYADSTISVYPNVPAVAVAPPLLAFSPQQVGTRSKPQLVLFSNPGSSPVTISGIGINGDFVQKSNCPIAPATLGIGQYCRIGVAFQPTRTGTRNGRLGIKDNSPFRVKTVGLTGTGDLESGPRKP